MKKSLVALALLSIGLVACGDKDVSFDTLESARSKAKSNGEWNAQKYRATSVYSGWAIESQGDSTQMTNCPQGDGWASVRLINKDNPNQKVSLKCSTVSSSIGCLLDSDFKTKSYATDDGKCQDNSKVPFPLPTLDK